MCSKVVLISKSFIQKWIIFTVTPRFLFTLNKKYCNSFKWHTKYIWLKKNIPTETQLCNYFKSRNNVVCQRPPYNYLNKKIEQTARHYKSIVLIRILIEANANANPPTQKSYESDPLIHNKKIRNHRTIRFVHFALGCCVYKHKNFLFGASIYKMHGPNLK